MLLKSFMFIMQTLISKHPTDFYKVPRVTSVDDVIFRSIFWKRVSKIRIQYPGLTDGELQLAIRNYEGYPDPFEPAPLVRQEAIIFDSETDDDDVGVSLMDDFIFNRCESDLLTFVKTFAVSQRQEGGGYDGDIFIYKFYLFNDLMNDKHTSAYMYKNITTYIRNYTQGNTGRYEAYDAHTRYLLRFYLFEKTWHDKTMVTTEDIEILLSIMPNKYDRLLAVLAYKHMMKRKGSSLIKNNAVYRCQICNTSINFILNYNNRDIHNGSIRHYRSMQKLVKSYLPKEKYEQNIITMIITYLDPFEYSECYDLVNPWSLDSIFMY